MAGQGEGEQFSLRHQGGYPEDRRRKCRERVREEVKAVRGECVAVREVRGEIRGHIMQ